MLNTICLYPQVILGHGRHKCFTGLTRPTKDVDCEVLFPAGVRQVVAPVLSVIGQEQVVDAEWLQRRGVPQYEPAGVHGLMNSALDGEHRAVRPVPDQSVSLRNLTVQNYGAPQNRQNDVIVSGCGKDKENGENKKTHFHFTQHSSHKRNQLWTTASHNLIWTSIWVGKFFRVTHV